MIGQCLSVTTITAICAGLSLSSAVADENAKVSRGRVDGSDIAEASGLDVYKWQVQLHKGQKVRLTLDVQSEMGAKPTNYLSREVIASSDGEATILASFLREDRKLASLFLSEDKRMDFRILWKGSANDGLTGFIKTPLGEIPLGQKALSIHREPQFVGGAWELLLLFRTEHIEGRGLSKLYPQASLKLEFED